MAGYWVNFTSVSHPASVHNAGAKSRRNCEAKDAKYHQNYSELLFNKRLTSSRRRIVIQKSFIKRLQHSERELKI
jgi:hypothetical protein